MSGSECRGPACAMRSYPFASYFSCLTEKSDTRHLSQGRRINRSVWLHHEKLYATQNGVTLREPARVYIGRPAVTGPRPLFSPAYFAGMPVTMRPGHEKPWRIGAGFGAFRTVEIKPERRAKKERNVERSLRGPGVRQAIPATTQGRQCLRRCPRTASNHSFRGSKGNTNTISPAFNAKYAKPIKKAENANVAGISPLRKPKWVPRIAASSVSAAGKLPVQAGLTENPPFRRQVFGRPQIPKRAVENTPAP